jgi:hypothetical protein
LYLNSRVLFATVLPWPLEVFVVKFCGLMAKWSTVFEAGFAVGSSVDHISLLFMSQDRDPCFWLHIAQGV